MKYLSQLSEEEVRYICSVIPVKETVLYFKQNPKQFAKIMPGFRAKSMRSQEKVSALLFRYHNQPFISFFIEAHICRWLEEIQEHIALKIKNGADKETALLVTLPFCFFVDNIQLYFKLVNEQYSEEYIAFLSAAIKIIKENEEERAKLDTACKNKDSEISKLQASLNLANYHLESNKAILGKYIAEITVLKSVADKHEKLKTIIKAKEDEISTLNTKLHTRDEYIKQLKEELAEVKGICKLLESKIQAELERQQFITAAKEKSAKKIFGPKDIDEFKDNLKYNLKNIGLSAESEYFHLLIDHIGNILFQGIPILVNKRVSMPLAKCIANSSIGTPNVRTLIFRNSISEIDIDEFLSEDERIVCLDNFIGNYNETVLLSLCEKHKDKVIFLTVTYDRTVNYVPDEFLKYCHYFNVNRIGALSVGVDLSEPPSTIEFIEIPSQKIAADRRYSSLLREILEELEFRKNLIEYKCSTITNERDLCCSLAFDILPYCTDVLQIEPYNTSERLLKYSGETGRCPYKNLLRGWFE